MDEINNFKKQLSDDAENLVGWDELKVLRVTKYGTEAVVHTDKGIIKMSMRELFVQYHFMLKVFETFGISLQKQQEALYGKWRAQWVKDLVIFEDSDNMLVTVEEALISYCKRAGEDSGGNYSTLLNGEPVFITRNEVAFKVIDFLNFFNKKNSTKINIDQMRIILKDIGCKSDTRFGKQGIRAWVFKIPEQKETKQVEIEV